MITPQELKCLHAIIRRAEACPAPHAAELPPDIAAGDVVQIRPFANRTYGGMLTVITKAEPYGLRGYLLRPHRGGCRDAWLRFKHCEVERVGRTFWPADATDFAGRCEDHGAPRCAQLLRRRAALAATLNGDAHDGAYDDKRRA